MTAEQVVQQLRAIRYGRPPSLRSLARAADMSPPKLYEAINTGRLSENHRQALAAALHGVKIVQYENPRSAGNSGPL